jgi:cytochrome o ubiquinol oxidase subunit 2
LFNPQGLISHDQHNLFMVLLVLLIVAAVPVVLFLYYVAWKFRESNTQAVHTPDKQHSRRLVFSIWAYPILFFFIFVSILWPVTFKIQPHKAIADAGQPLVVQVIAMRWKWLFLYPDQGVASVNYVQLPIDRPVTFALTADDVSMSSFWIPNLGGQLYAMTGHVNQLNLLPDKVGTYPGSTAEINGGGFADMKFTATVGTQSDFNTWVRDVRQGNNVLDTSAYNKLLKPTEDNPPQMYSNYQRNLYDTVVMKYMAGMGHIHMTDDSGSGAHE